MKNKVVKGYMMELQIGMSYCYLFVEKATKKATIEAYERCTNKTIENPRWATAIKRGSKVDISSEYVAAFAINVQDGQYITRAE